MINILRKGACYPTLAGPEGIRFDITDSGPILLVRFHCPTTNEIDAFNEGKPAEFRFVELGGTIFLTVKFADLPWMDAPYNIHLSQNLSEPMEIPEGGGYILHVFLCGTDGAIHAMRFMGLSTNFSRELRKAAISQSHDNFDPALHDKNISEVYARYSSKDLAMLSSVYNKF